MTYKSSTVERQLAWVLTKGRVGERVSERECKNARWWLESKRGGVGIDGLLAVPNVCTASRKQEPTGSERNPVPLSQGHLQNLKLEAPTSR